MEKDMSAQLNILRAGIAQVATSQTEIAATLAEILKIASGQDDGEGENPLLEALERIEQAVASQTELLRAFARQQQAPRKPSS